MSAPPISVVSVKDFLRPFFHETEGSINCRTLADGKHGRQDFIPADNLAAVEILTPRLVTSFPALLVSARLLGQEEVHHLTGLSRSTIWRLRRAGKFPMPIQATPTRAIQEEIMTDEKHEKSSLESGMGATAEAPAAPIARGTKITGSDEFDPAKLRLSQDFAQMAPTKKLIVSIPVHRPNKQTFVRCHPDEDYWFPAGVLEMTDDREIYIVAPSLHESLSQEIVAKILVTSITSQGVLFLWPIRLPKADGRLDDWNRVAREAANYAINSWVRLIPNQSLGSYEIRVAEGALPEPDWPSLPFKEILKIAFKDKLIQTHDHPVLQSLRGQV